MFVNMYVGQPLYCTQQNIPIFFFKRANHCLCSVVFYFLWSYFHFRADIETTYAKSLAKLSSKAQKCNKDATGWVLKEVASTQMLFLKIPIEQNMPTKTGNNSIYFLHQCLNLSFSDAHGTPTVVFMHLGEQQQNYRK